MNDMWIDCTWSSKVDCSHVCTISYADSNAENEKFTTLIVIEISGIEVMKESFTVV